MSIHRRLITTPTKPVKYWFLIRKEGCVEWSAYHLTYLERASVLDSYQVRGPFKSFLDCLIAAR